jgi:phosphoribosylamine-glycine ligase
MIVVARAATLAEAHTYVAKEIEKIECENLLHRNDIGYQAFKK